MSNTTQLDRGAAVDAAIDKIVPVLQAKNVTKEFATGGSGLRRGRIAAVDQVSLNLYDQPPQIIEPLSPTKRLPVAGIDLPSSSNSSGVNGRMPPSYQ